MNEFNIPKPDAGWNKKIVRSVEDIEGSIHFEKIYTEWRIVDLYHNKEESMEIISRKLKISTYKISKVASYFAENGSLPSFKKIKSQKIWPSSKDIEEFLIERYTRYDEIAPDWLTFFERFCSEFPESSSVSFSYFQRRMREDFNIKSLSFSQKRSNLSFEDESLLVYAYNNILMDLYLDDKKVLYYDSCSF